MKKRGTAQFDAFLKEDGHQTMELERREIFISQHASEPIPTTVVDMPYRGRVLCLMWCIRHTEAGYYANVVGYYA